jgi:hypothetical protein
MNNKYIFSCIFTILCFSQIAFAQSPIFRWDGTGDGTSWNDRLNWKNDTVPVAGAIIEFADSVTVTGTVPNRPAQCKVISSSLVTLNLNLDIQADTANQHGITLAARCTLVVAPNRSVSISAHPTKQGIFIGAATDSTSIRIETGATLNITQANNGIVMTNPRAELINQGTINMTAPIRTGIQTSGVVTNAGTINLSGLLVDGITLAAGTVTNQASGRINTTKVIDDGIEVRGAASLINKGRIEGVANDTAGIANHVIAVGTAMEMGTFTNEAGGIVNGSGGVDTFGRAIQVYEMGQANNVGTITLSGGAKSNRLYTRGVVTNQLGGVLDCTDGRATINLGTFTNNGLVKSTGTGAGVFVGMATATNNAFFLYQNSNTFAGGTTGTVVDNGINLKDATKTTIDAAGSCTVDIAETPYPWSVGAALIGTASATGSFTFPSMSVMTNEVSMSTTLPGVAITVKNICPTAVKSSSIFEPALKAQTLEIYPNIIAKGQTMVHISLPEQMRGRTEVNMQLVNQFGQSFSVNQVQNAHDFNQLTLPELSQGTYFILAKDQVGQLAVGRLVILR